MKTDSKKTKTPNGSDPQEEPGRIGARGFIGVVLLAAALFNVPSILKVPETTADKMMLIIVLTMALGGIILLLSLRKK